MDLNSRIPEIRLWRCVLLQAFLEATRGQRKYKAKDKRGLRYFVSKRELERRQSLSWFNASNKDFRLVCLFAGLEPDVVASNFKKRYFSNDPINSKNK